MKVILAHKAMSSSYQIFVKTLSGKTLVLNVRMDDTIQNIKDKIYDTEGIHPGNQKLTSFDGKTLDDGLTLSHYNISQQTELSLRFISHNNQTQQIQNKLTQIHIKTLTNKLLTLYVTPNNTIRDIKKAIEDEWQIPIEQQRIIHPGKVIYHMKNVSFDSVRATAMQLEDNQTLEYYNIKDGSGLFLVLRTRAFKQNQISPSQPFSGQIHIKTLSGKRVVIDVKHSDTVKRIKSKIYDEWGIETGNQRLLYAGYELQDELRMSDYGIRNEDMLHFVQGPAPSHDYDKQKNQSQQILKLTQQLNEAEIVIKKLKASNEEYKENKEKNERDMAFYNGTSHKYYTLDVKQCNDIELKLQRAMNKIRDRKDRLMNNKLNCIICYERAKCIAFDGCQHIAVCQECEKEMNDKKCPVCRKPYDAKKCRIMFI